jgi:hypothetical protein
LIDTPTLFFTGGELLARNVRFTPDFAAMLTVQVLRSMLSAAPGTQ